MKMQRHILFSSLLLSTLFLTPALAHNIRTNADVGVTFHIEPDHSPRAGESSRAWFALTRQGGELIPLSECDCELNVYLESASDSNEPILNPTLIAISPEQYQNIPGANLVFPQPGIYQLELTGKPTQEGNFTPFQVSYPVTVSPGVAQSPEETQSTETDSITTSDREQIQTSNNIKEEPEIAPSSQITPWLVASLVGVSGIVILSRK
jgi:hypothetical protein